MILMLSFICLAGIVGCRDAMPHSFTLAGGDIKRWHGKPMEGGYYTNWDPFSKSVDIIPLEDVNPVTTQHIMVVTVRDENGEPLPTRRVEWMIPEGSVGTFVEVDESGWTSTRGHKITNKYAITHTNTGPHTLTRGNDDPSDDIHLEKGQTWAVITSPVEGTTHVIAYVPGIYDWEKHKIFAQKHWYDVSWKFPPNATNPVKTAHRMTTSVAKHSDGKPLAGYEVTYAIVSGPKATFENGQQSQMVVTDSQGLASVTLNQVDPVEGTNEVKIDIVRPENKQCCKPAVHIASGLATKTWIGPKIGISKNAPATAIKGKNFMYDIVVTNPSQVTATNVVVTDPLPAGITYVSSNPAATVSGQNLTWNLGSLDSGADKALQVTVMANNIGTFENCAEVNADMGLNARDCASTVVTAPIIKITKVGPESVPTKCTPITYTITVTNEGDAPATNVVMKDELPEGMLWQGEHKVIKSDIGTLQPGQSRAGSFTVNATGPGKYVNTSVVTADDGLQDSATVTTIVYQPVLKVTKTAPAQRYIGRDMTYSITVTNTGDGPTENTVLTDTLPSQVSFISATKQGSHNAGTITWDLGTLLPGASTTVDVSVNAATIGSAKNVAAAKAFCTEDQASTVTEIRGIPAILLECIDIADPIEIGKEETYEITVTNQGSAEDTNVTITCVLPPEMTFVDASGPTQATVTGQTVAFEPVTNLQPKAKIVFRVKAKGASEGDARFKVTMTSDQITSPVEETESTNVYKD